MALDTTLMSVLMMGSTLIAMPPIRRSPSGLPRSFIGPNDAPVRYILFDSILYAARKKGICKRRDTVLFKTLSGL